MIKFQSVKIRNFLSIGDNPIEISLDKSPMTLVTGKNGSGKTTLSEAIVFGLFGKSYRGIVKNSLINSINKRDCVVEIEFLKGSEQFKIVRGIKPNILEVIRDGEAMHEAAAVKDAQEFIEKSILGFDFSAFIKVCVLGTTNYVSFLELSSSERRSFVETMLGIGVFTEMNKIHKSNIAKFKDRYIEVSQDIKVKRTQYDERRRMLDIMTADVEARNQKFRDQAKAIALEVQQLQVDHQEILDRWSPRGAELPVLIREAIENKNQLQSKKIDLEYRMESIERELSGIMNTDTCTSCKQSIPHSHKKDQQEQAAKKLSELRPVAEELQEQYDTAREQVTVLAAELDSVKAELSKVSGLEILIKQKKQAVRSVMENIETVKDHSEIESELKSLKQELKDLAAEYSLLTLQKDVLTHMTDMLKDGGVKSAIIRKFVPILEGYVNQYLQQMNFPITFSMDENFEETIKTRHGVPYSYGNLSMGERHRVTLAMLFAWRQVAKMKGSVNTNLLIFDEILDNALDAAGTEDAFGIIEDVCSDENVFIVSHKNHLDEKVRNILRLEKVNGFTRIA